MITDRDIVVRAVAADRNPLDLTVGDVMSRPVAFVHSDDSIEAAFKTLEENQVRRVPVLDQGGQLVGIVSQADLARIVPVQLAGELIHTISQGVDIGHD
jgi:CBS domain-containing protein